MESKEKDIGSLKDKLKELQTKLTKLNEKNKEELMDSETNDNSH